MPTAIRSTTGAIVDRIFDTYLERGVRPYVEIGFMPQALSSKPEPVPPEWRPGFRYEAIAGGWAFPPKDYARWGELVYQWVKHCVERYGARGSRTVVFRNLERGQLSGILVRHSAGIPASCMTTPSTGVRRALPTARVGGPDTAGHGGEFMEDFLEHVIGGTNHATGETGTPTDFVAFHAKGNATYIDGHVGSACARS